MISFPIASLIVVFASGLAWCAGGLHFARRFNRASGEFRMQVSDQVIEVEQTAAHLVGVRVVIDIMPGVMIDDAHRVARRLAEAACEVLIDRRQCLAAGPIDVD